MTTDLETLRMHEAALMRSYQRAAYHASSRSADSLCRREFDALDYAITRLREDIANAERRAAEVAAQCPSCGGTGEQISWSSLSDYCTCRECRGTGKRKEGELQCTR